MIDPGLVGILTKVVAYGFASSIAAGILRLVNRDNFGPDLSQSLAIGFLVGATFGAIVGMFDSLLDRT